MKSNTILFAVFLLCAFTSYLPSATSQFVEDINGSPLRNGGKYYILSSITALGGIRPAATGNERCPLTVVQSRQELDKGVAATLASPFRIAFLTEGIPLSIEFGNFAVITLCAGMDTRWSVVKGESGEPAAVKINTNEDVMEGMFKIARVSRELNNYKLVFCPRLGNKCGDIGIDVDDEGMRRLVVSQNNKPIVVQFQKADESPEDDEVTLQYATKNHKLSGSQ